MEVVITKCPKLQNLGNKTFSLSQREYDLVTDTKVRSVIEIYDEHSDLERKLIKRITKAKYSQLKCTPRTRTVELDGTTQQANYFVVDYSRVK